MLACAAKMFKDCTLLDVPHVAHRVKRSDFDASLGVNAQIVQLLDIVSLFGDESAKDLETLQRVALPVQRLVLN